VRNKLGVRTQRAPGAGSTGERLQLLPSQQGAGIKAPAREAPPRAIAQGRGFFAGNPILIEKLDSASMH
jgi:hypothetical protein